MHPKPTIGSNADYTARVAAAIDALDRRLKGNYLINGAFQVWQRGTSFVPGSGTYTADRWSVVRSVAGSTASRQTGQANQYALRVQRDSGNASVVEIVTSQSLESFNCYGLAGLPMTIKFKARCGANFSAASSAIALGVYSGTGTDENVAIGYTGANVFISVSPVLSTTQATYEYTGTVPAGTKELAVRVGFTPVGTASTNDWFELEEVQIVVGDYAGNFPYRDYAEELALCRRFYERVQHDGNNLILGVGCVLTTSTAKVDYYFRVPKRAASATFGSSTASGFIFQNGAANTAVTSLGASNINKDSAQIDVGTGATLTAGQAGHLINTNTSTYIEFGCEL